MDYLYLVHKNDHDNLSFKDLLEIHADWETNPNWNFLTCTWKTFFFDKVTEGAYVSMITSLNKNTLDTGKLKQQKMIYTVACCDSNFSIEWVRYCQLVGSNEHLKRLKELKYLVKTTQQVSQTVKAISEKAGTPAPKAEHILCTHIYQTNSPRM
jgi:hypothetical protein